MSPCTLMKSKTNFSDYILPSFSLKIRVNEMTDGKTLTSTTTANSFDQSSWGSVFNNFFDNEIPREIDLDKAVDMAANTMKKTLILLGNTFALKVDFTAIQNSEINSSLKKPAFAVVTNKAKIPTENDGIFMEYSW